MPDDFQRQADDLAASVAAHAKANRDEFCKCVSEEASCLLAWLEYLRTSEATGVADALLNGVQGAIIETAGCLTLGLVRPALSSLRLQVDMTLSWLYFKDHPVEWSHLRDTGRGFQTKSGVWNYVSEHHPQFNDRFRLLERVKSRREADPYRLLSAHIHGQTDFTAPTVGPLSGLVAERRLCDECVELQGEVSEYLSDFLLSAYGDKWASLPPCAQNELESRLGLDQRAAFFAPSHGR